MIITHIVTLKVAEKKATTGNPPAETSLLMLIVGTVLLIYHQPSLLNVGISS